MRAIPMFLAALSLTAVGCAADADEDGLTKAEEIELGTDPREADSDGDGLSDGQEHLETGTNPLVGDTDGDGLLDGEEVNEYGTDPTKRDSDGEGFLDGEEVDADSDPMDPTSWPDNLDGRWPDNTDLLTEVDRGWEQGKQIFDFPVVDQHGNELNMYQFAGHVIIFDMSAGWCGPCRAVAAQAQELYQAHRDEGLLIFHMMVDDNQNGGGVTDPTFLKGWADQYGLTFPVVKDDRQVARSGFARSGLYDNAIPWLAVLDRNLVVRSYGRGAAIEAAAISLLSE